MCAEGDILLAGGADAAVPGPGDGAAPTEAEGLVWLVGGEELPFEENSASHRPWLEESATWGAPASDEPPAPAPSDPPELLWL